MPVIHDDQCESNDNRQHKQNRGNQPTEFFVFVVGVHDEGRDEEELEVNCQIPSLNRTIVTHPKQ